MSGEASRTVPKCRGVRRDGQPCGSTITDASGYCFAHSEERTAERLEARRRGGRASSKLNRGRRLAPPALLPLFEVLEQALTETHAGQLAPAQAQAMAAIGRCLVLVATSGELEQRIRDIEAVLR